ncbi:MAG TPA: PilZ domain-containing protein [Candidatus Acidoferrum sp.]|nr:PilZ domain-containing protein [Candidatus Acidoferrum sp.]
MFRDKTGRKEKRLPVMIPVTLEPVWPESTEKRERTYTDNISARGARVRATCTWQPGEEAEIAPLKGEPPMRGEVVYCQKLPHGSFFIGLRFESHIPWSILQRYNNILMVSVF